ncbi:MAG: bifunctional glutamate N-acetyltransferase/amino-acid acetyltransferase ArgJ [Elusimicrobia bacterium]|nr:bifunctional glutamate N-acetyltransferase/amino-acid acetyltransferase ArgJ [Elusimicrobiota bacterium]
MNFPKGFFANGLHCGIKKNGKKDLSIFYSEKPSVAAGVFTKNIFKAAPVIISQKNIKNKIHCIVANSGCANACTGERGIGDVKKICELTADKLNVKPENILVASTGVIGQYLPMEKIENGIRKLCLYIPPTNRPKSAVEGIMTTDTFPKVVSSTFYLLPSTRCTIWACAKGSGMIEPNLATMLSFILTDAQITKEALSRALKIATEKSFNCLTVDGDTSTNDTVFVLANGAAKNKLISDGKNFQLFCDKLTAVCIELTKMLASDGEGATKLIAINVRDAKNICDAKKIAKTVANSPLVKTAIFGNDANWGRIVAAIGRSEVMVDSKKVDVSFSNLCVFKKGCPVSFSEKIARKIILQKVVSININLNSGKEYATVYTCDFSDGYIKVNASYRT